MARAKAYEIEPDKKFNMLTVISETERPENSKDKHRFFLCRCDCGNTTIISMSNLGTTKSCGCARHIGHNTKHGFASHKIYDKIYHTWTAIKYRCFNKNSKDYPHYGGRGITMCDEWSNDFMKFRSWCLSNGFQNNLTIDRIDVNGNYEPSNCRWVTVAEQNRNKTTTKKKGTN